MLIFTWVVLTTVLTLSEGRRSALHDALRYEAILHVHAEEVDRIREKSFGEPDPEAGIALDNWVPNENEKPWESGPYYGGDILTREQGGRYYDTDITEAGRNGLRGEKYKWPNATVPYEIEAVFNAKEMKLITKAFNNYQKETCIKFVKHTTEPNYIILKAAKTGCHSTVGKNLGPGPQTVNLQQPKCSNSFETIVHELMHAIGFDHEANQYGRDEWVDINWPNIDKSKRHNFEIDKKSNYTNFGVEYNYNSVMHYGGFFFSKNSSKPTMIAKKKKPLKFMGARPGKFMMPSDVKKVNMMYDCPAKKTTPKPKKQSNKKPFKPAIRPSIPELMHKYEWLEQHLEPSQ